MPSSIEVDMGLVECFLVPDLCTEGVGRLLVVSFFVFIGGEGGWEWYGPFQRSDPQLRGFKQAPHLQDTPTNGQRQGPDVA